MPEPLRERNDDSIALIVRYIRYSADKMGLKDWQFTVAEEPCAEGKIASTEVWGSSMTATIWLGDSFWNYGPKMQREVLIHEITHWHTDKLYELAAGIANRSLSREAFTIANLGLNQVHELAVDSIASAWARMLPLISEIPDLYTYPEYETPPIDSDVIQKDEVVSKPRSEDG